MAEHDALVRPEPPHHRLRAVLHLEKLALDGAPGLGERLEEEADHRRAGRDVVELGLALLGRHAARGRPVPRRAVLGLVDGERARTTAAPDEMRATRANTR